MKKQNFVKIANYMWQGVNYAYSNFSSASEGIATMWNPNRINCRVILWNSHFVVVAFNDERYNLVL